MYVHAGTHVHTCMHIRTYILIEDDDTVVYLEEVPVMAMAEFKGEHMGVWSSCDIKFIIPCVSPPRTNRS